MVKNSSRSRLNNFDCIRFLLAAMVLVSHVQILDQAFLLKVAKNGAEASTNMVHFLGPGRMAVNGFFIISGYLVTASWLYSKGLLDYLKKRFLRIYPALLFVLVLGAFIVAPLGRNPMDFKFADLNTYLYILRPLLLIPNTDPSGIFVNTPYPNAVNTPLWTIRFEIICYLMVAIFGLLGILRNRRAVLAAFSICYISFIMQVCSFPHPWNLNIPYIGVMADVPRLFSFFLAGAVLLMYQDKIVYKWSYFAVSLAVILISVVMRQYHLPLLAATLPVFGTYCLMFLAFNDKIKFHHFAKYGDFSYGIYLYAFPTTQIISVYLWPHLAPHILHLHHGSLIGRCILSLVVFIITLSLSIMSWYIIEKPALRKKTSGSTVNTVVDNRPASEKAVVKV